MKYKPKIYAEALADSLSEKKSPIDGKKIVNNFLKLLEKNQDMKKAKEIVALAEALLLKKSGNKKVVLETARKGAVRDFVNTFAKKGDMVEEKINPAIIAGIKIIVNNEKQLDFSLSSKLSKLNVSRNY
jgi:F0F1-type ATP synthase delta subunit